MPELNLEDDPQWYKDAIIYEVHVRAFNDSSGDGMGDFRGLTQKLEYLQDLGVTAVWLLPFSPSPWRDDGYDISDYTDVHSAYGTLKDFQGFVREAHRRGIRVITEIVINHTSDQHPWFQRARRSPPGSKWRDYYVWTDDTTLYNEARIIFKDFEVSNWTWDPLAKAYYWHRFYSHQPDLNFDNPAVRQAVFDVVDFWFDLGVDAFRLDAVPYLYERPGTNCENLPETHNFLKELRAHVDSKHHNRMLLAEANQWPDDAIAYFGEGDECHMAFHFPVMPRMFMAGRMEDRYPIIEILQRTPSIPESSQWALFLRNHDELTLEMVTDEERDYMYRVYAHDRQMRINLGIRRRLAPLLGNDRRRIELMNALLFSLPGTPVIYYGDEIGMGDNIYLGDRNGVRTPMQWSADRNAGFSRCSPQKLYLPITSDPEYHYETLNVEAQQNNPNSLLWWMKRIIRQRKHFKAFGRGTIEFLHPENRKVLAFYRRFEEETLLVVANLSRFPQYAELDLSPFRGTIPVEVFGDAEFPRVGDRPYMITLGANSFYWFSLSERPARRESIELKAGAPVVTIPSWDRLLEDRTVSALTRLLPDYLRTRRWFGSKTRTIQGVNIRDIITLPGADSYLAIAEVEYTDAEAELYILPVAVALGDDAAAVQAEHSDTLVARLRARDGSEGILYGAIWSARFADVLIGAIARRRRFRGKFGELAGVHGRKFRQIWGGRTANLDPAVSKAEQSNTSIVYGDRFILKLFRKVEPGLNPDVEINTYLSERQFPHIPPFAGLLEYRPGVGGEPLQIALLQGFVANQGDAWAYTLDSLSRYFESAFASRGLEEVPARHPLQLMEEPIPSRAEELAGTYLESARLLGRRTAEMHYALADPAGPPDFVPEAFTDHYRSGLYHSMTGHAHRTFDLLRRKARDLHGSVADEAAMVLERQNEVMARFAPLRTQRVQGVRTRHHGDFHLGQVLYTGKDFVIIDFEGEPGRAMTERRLKRSPLRDVAGMIRSLQYAAYAVLFGRIAGITASPDMLPALESWAAYWTAWASTAYLKGYFSHAREAPFLPGSRADVQTLLEAFLFEKALYEITYELNNRPDWVRIPLHGILKLLP